LKSRPFCIFGDPLPTIATLICPDFQQLVMVVPNQSTSS
jgi:hypothetical protein